MAQDKTLHEAVEIALELIQEKLEQVSQRGDNQAAHREEDRLLGAKERLEVLMEEYYEI